MSGKENGDLGKWPTKIARSKEKIRNIDKKIRKARENLRGLEEKKTAAEAALREIERKAEEARLNIEEKMAALQAQSELNFGTPLVEEDDPQQTDV